MSLILPGIINRSRSVCHLHPIQGLVVIYAFLLFYHHGISKCKKGIEIFYKLFWLEVKISLLGFQGRKF